MATAPTIQVRKAAPDDIPVLLPLIQSAYRGEESRKGWTTEADLMSGERIDAAGLLIKINEPQGAILITFLPDDSSSDSESDSADLSRRPVACCEVLALPDEGKAYFGLFAVDPNRQGGGIGKVVLERAETYARESLSATSMEMVVIWTREELIAWYERRGYVRTGEKRPFPYHLVNGMTLRDDLYMDVLEKPL